MKTPSIIKPMAGSLQRLALALALAAGLTAGSAQAQLTMSITGNGNNGLVEWNEADGYKFTTLATLEVSWLGFYDAPNGESGTVGDDLNAQHRVSLWRASDGVLMAQTFVQPGDELVGSFRGRSVTPVTLAPNTSYVIAADYGGTGDRLQNGSNLTGWELNGITIQEGRYGGPGGGMPPNPYSILIGPNFGYTLGPLSVTLTSPADNQAYQSGASITASATVEEPGPFTDTVTFHTTPVDPAGPTVETVSTDTASPFSADLGVLPAGTYEIYATVVNDDDPPGTATSATHTFTVEAAIPTTTVLAPAGSATTYGQNVTFTATVSPVPTGGTLQFFDGGSPLGSPVAVDTGTGEAIFSTTALAVGTHEITAEFQGHQIYETSATGASISHEVGQAVLTVKALNAYRSPNTANPDPLPYEITGYQNGEDLATSGVTGTPVLTTDAIFSSPLGSYVITCAPGTLTASNYSFTPVDGTLIVTDLAGQLGVLNLNANNGINPATGNPWALGDTYRLIFVTRGATTATSTDISTYNAFVQSEANASTAFPTLGSVSWSVVGSTAAVAARDNTATNPAVNGTGVPILLMDGTTLMAKDYNDLWDWRTRANVAPGFDQHGDSWLTGQVFTGMDGDAAGLQDAGGAVLGNSTGDASVKTGRSDGNFNSWAWATNWGAAATESRPVYAMSEVLTVVSSTPPAPTASLVIDLGASQAGTFIEGGQFIGSGPTNLPLPELPVGSILRSITIDASLDSATISNYASDLALLFDPTPETPGGDFSLEITNGDDPFGATASLGWPASADAEPPPAVPLADSKTAAAWSAAGPIDLATTGLFLGNAYIDSVPGGGTWSGTITLTYDIVSPETPFTTWAGGEAFDGDKNGDGVDNGIAFLLGADNPDANAQGVLPAADNDGSGLVLEFSMRNADSRGDAKLSVQWSKDLGVTDPWENNVALVPDADSTVNGVVFDITEGDPLNTVKATIPAAEGPDSKLFGRLAGSEN